MIRLTEPRLAFALRCVPVVLIVVGLVGAIGCSGELVRAVFVLAVLGGSYTHGLLEERMRAARGTFLEDGPPVSIPREAASWLSGCEHVTLPVADSPDRAGMLHEVLAGADRTLSWCPICQAVYAPPMLLEHHRDDCPRERALRTLRYAMGKEP